MEVRASFLSTFGFSGFSNSPVGRVFVLGCISLLPGFYAPPHPHRINHGGRKTSLPCERSCRAVTVIDSVGVRGHIKARQQ